MGEEVIKFIEIFLDALPVLFLIGAIVLYQYTDDTLEKIKYLLWAILFQTIPIVNYVM